MSLLMLFYFIFQNDTPSLVYFITALREMITTIKAEDTTWMLYLIDIYKDHNAPLPKEIVLEKILSN